MQRRQDWVLTVSKTLVSSRLAPQLLFLESMLKSETLKPEWNAQKEQWKMRLSTCSTPAVLENAVNELDKHIQWTRILVAPDGRPLTAEEIASGQFGAGGAPSAQLPPPLSEQPSTAPPDGVPRGMARMLLLLESMGACQYDPKVVVQLYDVMYRWTSHALVDARDYAVMRTLSTLDAGRVQETQQMLQLDPSKLVLEEKDVKLAVQGRAEHQFTQVAPREVVAQQAADTNSEPMAILPRKMRVALPSDLTQCEPGARWLIQRGLDAGSDEDDDDDDDDDDAVGWSNGMGAASSSAASSAASCSTTSCSAAPLSSRAISASGQPASLQPGVKHELSGGPTRDPKRPRLA